MFGSIFFLSQFMQNVLGNTPLQAGLKLLVWTGATMIVAPLAGVFSERIGSRPFMAAGLLLQAGALAWLDVTAPYCAFAATIALCFKLASVALINNELPKSRLQAIAFWAIVLSLFLGGAQIQFLRATLYQETLEWAGAIAAAFTYCAVRGLIAR